MSARALLGVLAASSVTFLAGWLSIVHLDMPGMTRTKASVFLDNYCRCCERWAQHMMDSGYEIELRPVTLSELRRRTRSLGIPEDKEACHTTVIDGLVVEGHVPADIIGRALRDRTKWVALSVPDMPYGSPGMEHDVTEPYDVFGLRHDGTWEVIERRGAGEGR